jgi:hypothetical protein
MAHEYSDGCPCEECSQTWNKALFAAVDRGEAKKKTSKKKAGKKRRRQT